MTSDTAIPLQDDVPGAPQDITRLYFDGGESFGHRHARPSTAVTAARAWDDDQLLDAAHVGAAGREVHTDILAALCTRYVDMATAVRTQTAAITAELIGERSESVRLAQLHAELSRQLVEVLWLYALISDENLMLRRRLEVNDVTGQDTTEHDAAETMRFVPQFDTEVVDLPLWPEFRS